MKAIIEVEELMVGSNRVVFKSNGRNYIFFKNEIEIISKKNCKNCKHEFPESDECISCYDGSNYEEKKKVMSDIKLTKKQMTELLKDAYPEDDEQDILRAVDHLKKTKWIVKDEVERVIEEWNNRLNNLVMWQEKNDKIQGLLIIETAQNVIDLLQKRIKELEAEK